MRAHAVFVLPLFLSAAHAQDFSELDTAAGLALFERTWVSAPSSTAAADGLGPYYTARSCAACHDDGGAGRIALDAMNLVIDDPVYGQLLQLRAVQGMPAEAVAMLSEEITQTIVLEEGAVVLRKPVLHVEALNHGELQSEVSLRRAPGLNGVAALALVDARQIEALADPDDLDGDGISGRVALAAGGTTGRFGWKAGGASLSTQLARALSFDLGLGNSALPSAAGDCTEHQTACLQAAHASEDMEVSPLMENLLLSYLNSLPVPAAAESDPAGETAFIELGCTACHVPHLETAAGSLMPYSDLLLHDMGPGLDDGLAGDHAQSTEWRTPPLWNLAANPRFLHDGRAATLSEAILWHGGEAAASVMAYRRLNAEQRKLLHAWLLAL